VQPAGNLPAGRRAPPAAGAKQATTPPPLNKSGDKEPNRPHGFLCITAQGTPYLASSGFSPQLARGIIARLLHKLYAFASISNSYAIGLCILKIYQKS